MGMTLSGGMTIIGGMSAISPPPPPTGFIFDSTKKASFLTLSNSDLTVTNNDTGPQTYGMVLTTGAAKTIPGIGQPVERYAVEYNISGFNLNGTSVFLGFGEVNPGPPNYENPSYVLQWTLARFNLDGPNVDVYLGPGSTTRYFVSAQNTFASKRVGIVYTLNPNTGVEGSYIGSVYVDGTLIANSVTIPRYPSVQVSPIVAFYESVNASVTLYNTTADMLYLGSYPVGTQAWPAA